MLKPGGSDFPAASSCKASYKWISVVGARPQFVKLAPVCRAIEIHNSASAPPALQIQHRIVHTGQHYDRELAGVFFDYMQIPQPDANLAAGSGSHAVQLARMLERLEPVFLAERPDWVVVYGDTNSTLAAAIVAARLHLPLAHVEAGCRSFDMAMPEEQTRVAADHLSSLLLAPSHSALRNLHREGIGTSDDPRNRRAAVVGDVMCDALLQNLPRARQRSRETIDRFGLASGGYYLLTLHRAENTDDPVRLRLLLDLAASLDLPVLFPVHPRTRDALATANISLARNLRPVPPLGYLEMLAVEQHARKILTDSGGVQKEAFFLRVPCITLRSTTEWPETVELGANRLVGSDPSKIQAAALHHTQALPWPVDIYGNGDASQRIVAEILAATHPASVPSTESLISIGAAQ